MTPGVVDLSAVLEESVRVFVSAVLYDQADKGTGLGMSVVQGLVVSMFLPW